MHTLVHLCGRRFDLFGVDHGDSTDQRSAADEALDHFHGRHGPVLTDVDEAARLLEPAGSTTRINRHRLLKPFRPS